MNIKQKTPSRNIVTKKSIQSLEWIYHYCLKLVNNRVAIVIKVTLLVYLDFQTASILQIQAQGFFRHPFIAANIILAIMFQVSAISVPIFFYKVMNKSTILIKHEHYQKKYGIIYEGLSIDNPKSKLFCIFSVIKKYLFVLFIVIFYEHPTI